MCGGVVIFSKFPKEFVEVLRNSDCSDTHLEDLMEVSASICRPDIKPVSVVATIWMKVSACELTFYSKSARVSRRYNVFCAKRATRNVFLQ